MKRLILNLIRLYQKTGSYRNLLITNIFPHGNSRVSNKGTCRFKPTCTQYMYEAINRYGIVRGALLGMRRIAKCHPWSKGGIDPVPNL